MYGALDISASALVAQRTRLNVISANIAGKQALLNADGEYEPYRRRFAVFAVGDPSRGISDGVHVQSIEIDPSRCVRSTSRARRTPTRTATSTTPTSTR